MTGIWAPAATPGEIEDLERAWDAAHGHAGHVEYTCGQGSPAARYAAHMARQAGRDLYEATHPGGPYVVRDGRVYELEAG